jgi:hypothetical protein
MGSAIFKRGRESPVTALKLSIKKSAYLKKPRSAILEITERERNSFLKAFVFDLSIASPRKYPRRIETIIRNTYLGSPQP